MKKEIDLTRSVYELVTDHPELADIMAELGFSEAKKPAMLHSVGKLMTIPKGAKMKNIPMEQIVMTLIQNGYVLAGQMPEAAHVQAPTEHSETADSRTEMLKGYLRRLGSGEDLEAVRADFAAEYQDVDAAEIMQAEQELMQEGTPLSEVQRLCDLHSALFHGATRNERIANAEKAVAESLRQQQAKAAYRNQDERAAALAGLLAIPGHPLQTLTQENENLSLHVVKALAQAIDGKDTYLGSGVCNIDYSPIIYVVKDAYWYERHAKVFSKSKAFNLDDDDTKPVNSYYIAKDASLPALRLISFLDPTSIGGIRLNTALYPEGLENVNVNISYGVFPGSNPGYTNAFRRAIGLEELPHWTLCTQSNFSTQDNTEFKTFKYPRTSDIFKDISTDDAVFADVVATRLSSQLINGNIERRYYGQSAYYTKQFVTPEEVDEVQYVSDPEIFVPFSIEKKCLYDPIVPDFVVTVQITANVSTGEGYFITNTLRFVPKIVLISYNDIDRIASEANSPVNYSTMDQLLNRLSNFTTAVK